MFLFMRRENWERETNLNPTHHDPGAPGAKAIIKVAKACNKDTGRRSKLISVNIGRDQRNSP